MMRGTFCDHLWGLNCKFSPETVIVEGTTVANAINTRYAHIPDNYQSNDINQIGRSVPPYSHMFIEYRFSSAEDGEIHVGNYIAQFSKPNDFIVFSFVRFYRDNGFQLFPPRFWHFDANGFFIGVNALVIKDTVRSEILRIDEKFSPYPVSLYHNGIHKLPADSGSSSDFISILSLLELHNKSEVELVDYPRNYRRRELRKNGKEPSPYFRIVAPGKPVKKNVGQSVGTGNHIQLPLHTVRGHFRHVENHPIEWFNGTFWIAAHTRGNEELGKLQAHYKIRLPEQDSIAS